MLCTKAPPSRGACHFPQLITLSSSDTGIVAARPCRCMPLLCSLSPFVSHRVSGLLLLRADELLQRLGRRELREDAPRLHVQGRHQEQRPRPAETSSTRRASGGAPAAELQAPLSLASPLFVVCERSHRSPWGAKIAGALAGFCRRALCRARLLQAKRHSRRPPCQHPTRVPGIPEARPGARLAVSLRKQRRNGRILESYLSGRHPRIRCVTRCSCRIDPPDSSRYR